MKMRKSVVYSNGVEVLIFPKKNDKYLCSLYFTAQRSRNNYEREEIEGEVVITPHLSYRGVNTNF